MSTLADARATLAALRASGDLEQLDPLERSARNPQSLDLAIKAMCYECTGRDEPGGSVEIATCDHWTCPLWQFRPHQARAPEGHGQGKRTAYLAAVAQRRGAESNAARHPRSRAAAVKAKCHQCMGSDRAAINQCTGTFPRERAGLPTPDGWRGCPLWPHRPRTSGTLVPTDAARGGIGAAEAGQG